MLADVVLLRNLQRAFTYRVPVHLTGTLEVGSQVFVPFGTATVQGLVIALNQPTDGPPTPTDKPPFTLKEILDLVPSTDDSRVDPDLVQLARQMSDYYLAPFGPCLRVVLMPRHRAAAAINRRLTLSDKGKTFQSLTRLSQPQMEVLTRLLRAPRGLSISTLKGQIPRFSQVLQTLKRRGLVEETSVPKPIRVKASGHRGEEVTPEITIRETGQDQALATRGVPGRGESPSHSQFALPQPLSLGNEPPWLGAFQAALMEHMPGEFLAYAPKQIVRHQLFHAVFHTLNAQRTSVLITPDIAHAQALSNQANQYWPNTAVCLHHELSATTYQSLLTTISQGRFRIVTGPRSTIFAPIPRLGLIGIVQEENVLLKDEQFPYYHAREVGRMRSRIQSAVLLLATPHPTVETVHQFSGSPTNLELFRAAAPDIQLIDLKQEPFGTWLSQEMLGGITRVLGERGRVILFLNRKGFSRVVTCTSCGFRPQCPRCAIPLAMYKHPPRLICAACRKAQDIPTLCPSCLMPHLHQRGIGIEQIEELVRDQFPDARVKRLDRDATPTPAETHVVHRQFNGGDIDVLIGTQLLVQQEGLAPADLVCLPYADAGLHVPDFRSAEQVFHQLFDVLALAAPKDRGGRAILQTFLPTHHVMQALSLQDPAIFYGHECAFRQALLYPPFSHLVLVTVSGKDEESVRRGAESWAKTIQREMSRHLNPSRDHSVHDQNLLLGPIPNTRGSRKTGQRYTILIKAVEFEKTRQIIRQSLATAPDKKGLQFRIKVDPLEML